MDGKDCCPPIVHSRVAERLIQLEKENARLKKLLAEAELEKAML